MNSGKPLHSQRLNKQAWKNLTSARLAVFLLISAAICWVSCGKDSAAEKAKSAPKTDSVSQAAASSKPEPDFQKLTGQWVRPDGGYVIEIREVDVYGNAEAGYFNPRPINVSRAEVSDDGTALMLFVELWDENYPGSNYTLTYDAEQDILYGIYYQAQMGQHFEVVFTRQK